MKLSTQIANQFREVYLNGKWIANTNLKEQLSDLSWQQATTKIDSLNSIAALAFHLNYYTAGLIKVFEGGPLDIKDKYSFDMTPVETEADWQTMVNDLISNAEQFKIHVSSMTDEQLYNPFVVEKYGTYLRNIEGVIEHAYYHLGQMVLIRKMIEHT